MASTAYRFGDFRLDPACRELRLGDEEVSLTPKAFGCLAYLVENRDRAVGRDELIDAVWGKENLADNVLSHAILAVRKALDDSGDEARYIKTVTGFGYRWVASVEVETIEDPAAAARRHPPWPWVALGVLAAGLLTLAGTLLWRGGEAEGVAAAWQRAEGDIALLLPVTVEPKDRHSWIRFGAMELIAERLREAGQPMVPSETVIALMRDLPDEPGPESLGRLTAATGARLVLGAHAEATGTRWRVSLRSLDEDRAPVTALAEAEDVLEAARMAADRMALSLGLTPAPEPDAEPGLALLLRQIESARLAQEMDVARKLIDNAVPELGRRPEVRLQEAWIEYDSYHLDAARQAFESLLNEPSIEHDPALRASALHGLAALHLINADLDAAETLLRRAIRDPGPDSTLPIFGRLQSSLSVVTLLQGRFDEARTHLAQAHRILNGTGDVRGLAILDNILGIFHALRERYIEALHHFGSAADAYQSLHNSGSELRARANMVEAYLGLLKPRGALKLEPRLNELLAQTTNPDLTAHGQLATVALLAANGRSGEAERLLAEALNALEPRGDLPESRTWGLLLRAEQLAQQGELVRAAEAAAEVVQLASAQESILLDDYLGRAWLILVRGYIDQGDLVAAREATAAMTEWAQRSKTTAPQIYAALAQGELAAHEGRDQAAHAAFEHALALADAGYVPLRTLHVAKLYVPWLLRRAAGSAVGREHALVVAHRVTRYVDQSYDAALLQLETYHGLGPSSSWRAALGRAQALAGERQIPPKLLKAPATPPS